MIGRATALGLGVLLLFACGDDDSPDARCAELRASLNELERRFDGESEQSWDDAQKTVHASAERDRLRSELAAAGCKPQTGG